MFKVSCYPPTKKQKRTTLRIVLPIEFEGQKFAMDYNFDRVKKTLSITLTRKPGAVESPRIKPFKIYKSTKVPAATFSLLPEKCPLDITSTEVTDVIVDGDQIYMEIDLTKVKPSRSYVMPEGIKRISTKHSFQTRQASLIDPSKLKAPERKVTAETEFQFEMEATITSNGVWGISIFAPENWPHVNQNFNITISKPTPQLCLTLTPQNDGKFFFVKRADGSRVCGCNSTMDLSAITRGPCEFVIAAVDKNFQFKRHFDKKPESKPEDFKQFKDLGDDTEKSVELDSVTPFERVRFKWLELKAIIEEENRAKPGSFILGEPPLHLCYQRVE